MRLEREPYTGDLMSGFTSSARAPAPPTPSPFLSMQDSQTVIAPQR